MHPLPTASTMPDPLETADPLPNPGGLTWALVVPTYQRPDVLQRCIRSALEQTLPPTEILVVDSSPDWDTTRDRVMSTLADGHPAGRGVRWVYEQARTPSASAQRLQAIPQATADILFTIDDDSLMYPTCAERVLSVYARDTDRRVQGLMTLLAATPPDVEDANPPAQPDADGHADANAQPTDAAPPQSLAKKLGRLKDRYKGPFLPPELTQPHHANLPDLGVRYNEVDALHGCRTTMRREAAQRHPYDPRLIYLNDETEMCLRARRDGPLICIHEPLIHHVAESGKLIGRKSRGYRAMFLISHAYMIRKLLDDDTRAREFVRGYNRRTRRLDLLLGLLRRDFAAARGSRAARPSIERILTCPPADLGPVFSEELGKFHKR